MTQLDLQSLMSKQRSYFATGKTRSLEFRLEQLKKLHSTIKAFDGEIVTALKKDLGRSEFEAYGSEIGIIYEELDLISSNLANWMQPQSVPTPLAYQPSSSTIYPQPHGVVLIIAPWNYPFQLLLAPLVGAIAAGNCCVLKPSELASESAKIITKIIEQTFAPEYCAVVNGGVEETSALLRERFDHIFFTGSIPVGKVVMRAAAEHLTPVTLELGGKSPCIVDSETDIKVTARRIAWGKFFNCGQTCVAPDYLLVPKSIKQELITALKAALHKFYGDNPQSSPDYGRIINQRHFDRLASMISGKVVVGGDHNRDQLYIAPTIVDDVKLSDKLMDDEIFGPLLPILEYETLDEAFAIVNQRPNPLACYVFSSRKSVQDRVVNELSFGGGCINDTLVHVGSAHLPFGGKGPSGIGNYHGHYSFLTFSHQKSIVRTPFMVDLPLKYPPYNKRVKLARLLIG